MAPTRWGIAGCGPISSDFVNALQHAGSDRHVVVAVAARSKDDAQKFAEKFGVTKYFDRYAALGEDPDIDVVYIGVINIFHLSLSSSFLNAGKPVLCEKPLCMNVAETRQLVDLAKEKKTFLMEGVWSRFFPVYRELQARLDRAEAGQVTHAFVNFGFPATPDMSLCKKATGGGAVLNLGIYAINFIVLAMGGEKPEEIKAMGSLNKEGVECDVSCSMRFSGNRFGSFILSINSSLPNEAFITGTKGTITLTDFFWSPTKLSGPSGDFELPLDSSDRQYILPNSQGFKYEADEVARCLKSGLQEHPTMPHSDSLMLAEIMQTVREQVGVKD